jgi:hypothetical protein
LILSTIQSVVGNLSRPCAFIFGNLFAVNSDLDIPKLTEGKDLVFVYIPPVKVKDDTEDTPLIHSTFTFNFMILQRIDKPTNDYTSEEVEPIIDGCRDLVREFLHSLNDEDIVEHGVTVNGTVRDGVDSWEMENIYGEFDMHLFGVAVNCELPVQEGKTGCV